MGYFQFTLHNYSDDGNLGNLIAVAGRYTALTYDPTNRLLSIQDTVRGVTDNYRYGPEGLRFEKVERSLNGADKKTYYLYEGNEILYEEGYEGTTRTFSKLNVFVGGMNIGRVKKEGGVESIQYFFTDHLGSRRAILDSTGAAQAKIDYTVWGVPTVTNYNGYEGSLDVSYTGKERDATGLYYFNARYYDASIGRFITEDPVRNGMNWFAYCGNNPLRFTDPTGLRTVSYEEPEAGAPGTARETEPEEIDYFKQKYFEDAFGIETNEFCVGTSLLNAYAYMSSLSYEDASAAIQTALGTGAVQIDGTTKVNAFSVIIAAQIDSDFMLTTTLYTSKEDFSNSTSELALVYMNPMHIELAAKSSTGISLIDPGQGREGYYRERAKDPYRPFQVVHR